MAERPERAEKPVVVSLEEYQTSGALKGLRLKVRIAGMLGVARSGAAVLVIVQQLAHSARTALVSCTVLARHLASLHAHPVLPLRLYGCPRRAGAIPRHSMRVVS